MCACKSDIQSISLGPLNQEKEHFLLITMNSVCAQQNIMWADEATAMLK